MIMLPCMSLPETKALWNGVIISLRNGLSLFVKTMDIILQLKLHKLIGLNCPGMVGFADFGISTISI